MKTCGQNSVFSTRCRSKAALLILLPVFAGLASCGEDEELQRQLIDLRKTVDAKNKLVEQLQAQVTDLQSKAQRAPAAPSGPSQEELTKAKARITELEQRLATAAAAPPPAAPSDLGKLDMDVIAAKLEDDLTQKAKQLRALVQKQSPSSRIDEITLKSIDYPPQLITPFTSAITFTVTVGTGTPLRLMFPVTADLSGSWKLPTPDEVQKAYKSAQDQPQGTLASTGSAPPAQGTPSAPPAPQPQTGSGGGARMTQRADGVFVFDWGDGTGAAPSRPPQQAYVPPAPAPAPSPSGGTPPSPPPQPAPRPPAAAPQAPNVPPPVMPIVGDRVIRFDD